MKKILTALAALAVVATPVAAEARHRDQDRVERPQRNRGAGNFIGGLLVGAIVGAAVLSSRQQEEVSGDYQYPRERDYYRPRRTCFEEQVVDYRYGRKYVYYEYRCR